MEIQKEVWVAIISAAPALLAPLLSWILQYRGVAQKIRELDVLEKRIQVIERLNGIGDALPEESRRVLRAELAAITQDLIADREREHAAGSTIVSHLPNWRRLLLYYEQPTAKASIYRGCYWFCLFGALSMISVGFEGDTLLGAAIPGMIFYLFIGLLFRGAAMRQQNRAAENAARFGESVG